MSLLAKGWGRPRAELEKKNNLDVVHRVRKQVSELNRWKDDFHFKLLLLLHCSGRRRHLENVAGTEEQWPGLETNH